MKNFEGELKLLKLRLATNPRIPAVKQYFKILIVVLIFLIFSVTLQPPDPSLFQAQTLRCSLPWRIDVIAKPEKKSLSFKSLASRALKA